MPSTEMIPLKNKLLMKMKALALDRHKKKYGLAD
jgi:hypothetical protein